MLSFVKSRMWQKFWKAEYFTIDEIKKICKNRDKYDSQFTGIFFEEYFWKILENLENKN